jgi:hypothetical protein
MENIVFSLEEKGNNLLLGEEDLNTFYSASTDISQLIYVKMMEPF